MTSIDRRNGRWRARWRDPAGKSHSLTFDRKVDAERHLTTVAHSVMVGAYVDPSAGRMTVDEFWRTWSARQPWRASSRAVIASYFTRHVLPELGARRLGTLRRGDIEAWASRLTVSASTSAQIAGHLSGMLEAAVADGVIATNPARAAKRAKVERAPVAPFADDDIDRLRAACAPWFTVTLDLGLGAGLRQSEATGLTLDRVDFLRRTLTVDRQLVMPVGGPVVLGPPKTARSRRVVPLADPVVKALAAHVEQHGTGELGLVLHEDGAPVRRHRFGIVWRELRATAKLPKARFHDTRHTYASTLLSGGVSVAATAEYLGHSPAMLLSTYAHLMPADHDRARAVVERAFLRDAVCPDGVPAAASEAALGA